MLIAAFTHIHPPPSPRLASQATSVELSVGIIKSCKAERLMFCKEVQAGQARVFRCLAENMNDADFGNNCKYQIINKLQRRWGKRRR